MAKTITADDHKLGGWSSETRVLFSYLVSKVNNCNVRLSQVETRTGAHTHTQVDMDFS